MNFNIIVLSAMRNSEEFGRFLPFAAANASTQHEAVWQTPPCWTLPKKTLVLARDKRRPHFLILKMVLRLEAWKGLFEGL